MRQQQLTTAEFASLASISVRKARQALLRALRGKTWRGASLLVDPVSGRGGLSGQQYTVRVDSLPADLQARLKEHFAIVQRPVFQSADNITSNKHNWLA